MNTLSWTLVGFSLAGLVYALVGYPLVLRLLRACGVRRESVLSSQGGWPSITITVPAYNEEAQIADTIESLLGVEYPGERQILIVSDASSDSTDDIVRGFQGRGVEFVRMAERTGKTELENQVASMARGEIVVNTDASIRLDPFAAVRLVECFEDDRVGVATGRDISKGASDHDANVGEAGYVGMEMGLRDLESDVNGLIGASGSLYAIRRDLHDYRLAGGLSRDFAAALVARINGFVTVSVPTALCTVPRATSIQREYRRKVRTVTRGMSTLWHFKVLLNPLRYGLFAWMLWSHKVARWSIPVLGLGLLVGLALQVPGSPVALLFTSIALVGLAVGGSAWVASAKGRELPKWLSLMAYGLASNVAVLHAWPRALLGQRQAIWEPTRR
ncbi:MAG: glycosyltransferase [Longimicrobiales bacterium]